MSSSYRSRQLSSNYEREQLETETKRVETKTLTKNDTHSKRQQRIVKDTQKGMSTENNIGVQTRAMAQWVDNEVNPEQEQKKTDQAATPTIELHRTKEHTIKEFVRQHGTINLDWYVPDLYNTRVGELIEKRLQLDTTEGRILFSSPALKKFFKTSNFELNLQTGEVFTYLNSPENIDTTCQKEPFDIESLRDTLQGKSNTSPMQEERLERIPSVKKLAGPADIMPVEEAEYKVRQYYHLWTMYADSSVELKKKSELSQESAVAACKMYVPYISDIEHQIEEVVKIFAMEKELRLIKNRGYFPAPYLAPKECKIETIQDKEALIKEIDEVAVEMLTAIKESEENYKKEQEQARIREEQLRFARQTSRSDINLLTLANSTPIRNTNTRSDQPGVHFNTNPVHHVYATTSDRGEQYEPPENDSILQGATSSPADQFATNATDTAGRKQPWRRNNATNVGSNTFNHRTTTRLTSRNGLQINNPSNPTDPRSGPTCFRCGEQGHMRGKCRRKVFCNHCRSYNHDTKACRKQHDNTPSPTHSQIATGYHPTVMTPPPLMGTSAPIQPTEPHNNPLFNLLDNNQPRTSTLTHTPHNGTSPATPADLLDGITQIMNRVTNDNKRDDASKKMMKNIKIFKGSNKAECITWLSQVEAAAKFTNTPFRELICQSMGTCYATCIFRLNGTSV